MDESIARRTAVGVAALIGSIYLASLVVYAWIESWQLADLGDALGFSLWITAFTVVGVIIAFHRPGNPVAWICLTFGGVWSIWILLDGLLIYEAAHPGTLTRPDLTAALAHPLWVPGVGLIGFLLLLFPDGHLPSPRWRPVAWLLGGNIAVLTVTELLLPGVLQDREYVNPLGIEALEPFYQGAPGIALVMILVLCILASALSVVVRYRRTVGVERLQLKWMMAAGLVAALAYALLFFWDGFYIQVVWAVIPVAIGFSMHRHRLYDIDRLISRTVSYALVIGLLALVYIGGVFLMNLVFPLEREPGRRRIDPGGRRAIQPFATPGPGSRGSPFQPNPTRRCEGDRLIRSDPGQRGRSRPDRRRVDRDCLDDHPTGHRGSLGEVGGTNGFRPCDRPTSTVRLLTHMNCFAHVHHHHHPSRVG
ncbi:MAG: hypothetical protein M3P87_02005 [Actinomycetota bacterium]|nr:hypothetical protein [Actinomycetota bacterium]